MATKPAALAPKPAKAKRPAPLLPPAPETDRPLFLVVAVIVALACAAALGARTVWDASERWGGELAGAMTIQVRASAGPDAPGRAAAAVRSVPGVVSARALTRVEAERLLEPYLGKAGLPEGAPVPGLVDVRIDRNAPPTAAALAAALELASVDATVDDHARWSGALARAAGAARGLALGLFGVLVVTAAAITTFAVRSSLMSRREIVEVLHLVGASDRFIAREFTRRFLSLGLRAGLLGALLAAAAATLFQLAGGGLAGGAEQWFLPSYRLTWADAAILAAAPLASCFTAALAARETVLRALKDVT